MKKLHSFTLGAVLLAMASGAQAVLLTDLLAGGTITAGDKIFDQWTVVFESTHDLHAINTNNIDVTPLNDGGLDPGPGLHFDLLNNEFSVTGDNFFAFTNFVFGFRVTPLDPTMRIKDVSMGEVGFSSTHTVDGFNDLGFEIAESVGTAAGLADLALLTVNRDIFDDVTSSVNSDSANFGLQNAVWVEKDIFVWSQDDTDTFTLNAFEQRFSQEQIQVPEPASTLLFGLGLLTIGAVRRRRSGH